MSQKSFLQAARARALSLFRDPLFREGAVEAIPLALGIVAWGVVAGVAMTKSGMGVGLSIFMSVIVYAGTAQVVAVPLIAANAPLWVILATTLCVSLRFVAFSFHLRPYFAHLPRAQRVLIGYFLGDSNFGLFARRFPQPQPGAGQENYYYGNALVTYVAWQGAIITGIVAGHAIPPSWGLGFAGTMALLALTCSQLRDRSTWIAAVVAGSAAVAAYGLPLKLNIVVAIAAAVAFSAMAHAARTAKAAA